MKKTYSKVTDLLNATIPEKISRNEFCRITGLNRNSVDRYMAGLGRPSDESLVKLSNYFGVSVSSLRGEREKIEIIQGRTPHRVIELLHAEIPSRISMNKFCQKSGINSLSLQRYMAGITEPNMASLQKLANYFNETFIIEVKPEQNQSSSNS